MPDITMCEGTDCPLKEKCYRFTATPSQWRQSYFMEVPVKEDKTCDHFYDNSAWQPKQKQEERGI